MWTFKIFFQDDGEFFEYDPFGMEGVTGTEKALPFLESLLSFLELDSTTGGLGPGAVLLQWRCRIQ